MHWRRVKLSNSNNAVIPKLLLEIRIENIENEMERFSSL